MNEIRTVEALRYILPLREGGSLPALIDADDDFKYVLKFRGGGHGAKALIAEFIGGELARAARLRVPEQVFVNLDEDFGRTVGEPLDSPPPAIPMVASRATSTRCRPMERVLSRATHGISLSMFLTMSSALSKLWVATVNSYRVSTSYSPCTFRRNTMRRMKI